MTKRPQDPEGRLPMVVARRQTASTLYAALHEPVLFRDKGKPINQPRIRGVELVAQTPDAIAIKVIGPDYVDYTMVSFGSPAEEPREVTLAHPASGEKFVFRNYAYLRCKGKSVVGRGGLVSFVISDSGLGTSPTLRLNGQQAVMNNVEGRWHYDK